MRVGQQGGQYEVVSHANAMGATSEPGGPHIDGIEVCKKNMTKLMLFKQSIHAIKLGKAGGFWRIKNGVNSRMIAK